MGKKITSQKLPCKTKLMTYPSQNLAIWLIKINNEDITVTLTDLRVSKYMKTRLLKSTDTTMFQASEHRCERFERCKQ